MGRRWVETEVVVRFHECDPMGIAHHARYFEWLELGRFVLAEAAGLDDRDIPISLSVPVLRASIRYLHSVRYRERIMIRTALDHPIAAKLVFHYQIVRLSTARMLVATASTEHALLNSNGALMFQLPDAVKDKIDKFLSP